LAAPPDSSTVCLLRRHASLIRDPRGKAVTLESKNDKGLLSLFLLFLQELLGGAETTTAEEESLCAEVEAEAIAAGIISRSSAPPPPPPLLRLFSSPPGIRKGAPA
jgi:hypothetical protein